MSIIEKENAERLLMERITAFLADVENENGLPSQISKLERYVDAMKWRMQIRYKGMNNAPQEEVNRLMKAIKLQDEWELLRLPIMSKDK